MIDRNFSVRSTNHLKEISRPPKIPFSNFLNNAVSGLTYIRPDGLVKLEREFVSKSARPALQNKNERGDVPPQRKQQLT